MCGINGFIKFDVPKINEGSLEIMNNSIIHRGPDDQGTFSENNVGLGHVRLSIIDLSARGHQPMVYEHNQKKVIITFNGEIYNFKELRTELEKEGYRFSSDTDTEVMLACYLRYGTRCVEKFNGMFAFVIYDPQQSLLFGARDRFGKKPLKYYHDKNTFIFSSEIKAILTHGIKKEIDYDAINDYLTLQYVPAPKTGFKNIWKLPHAHYFTLDIKKNILHIEKYFDIDFEKKESHTQTEWEKIITDELETAIKKRLVADVPLGAFLSGGVDSSAIVALASKYTQKLKTFSIIFKEKKFNEGPYAQMVAKKYKTEHMEFLCEAHQLVDSVENLTEHFEEPFADSSNLPSYILAKKTKQHVTVALSGDAGDENFGGYPKYQVHILLKKYKWLLSWMKIFNPMVKLIEKLKKTNWTDYWWAIQRMITMSPGERHYNLTNYFDEWTKKEFYRENFHSRMQRKECLFNEILKNKKFEYLDKIFYLDFNSYIPDDINVKVDMASMISALEVRVPMLDYEFVTKMATIPSSLKTDIKQGKKIFKKMLEKYLDHVILYRKKHGFSVPMKHWFRKELKEQMIGSLMDTKGLVHEIMKPEKVKQLIQEHINGKDNAKKLWCLFVLNMWHKKYFLSPIKR